MQEILKIIPEIITNYHPICDYWLNGNFLCVSLLVHSYNARKKNNVFFS